MNVLLTTPLHPGEILREEFLVPLGMSAGELAKALGVPRIRIKRIVDEKMSITTDTALRLGRYFNTTPTLWLNLQRSYELAVLGPLLKEQLGAIQPRQSETGTPP